MAVEDEHAHTKAQVAPTMEMKEKELDNGSTGGSEEKKHAVDGYLPRSDADYVVTWKTWAVVWILAWSYGISFWIVPSAAAAQAVIATDLGDVTKEAWVSILLPAKSATC